MGEAKRKRATYENAYATGGVYQPTPQCPACRSKRVRRIRKGDVASLDEYFGCDLETCLDCRALWEAWPESGYIPEPVCAQPCDNCAFRPGSPEQQDPVKWRPLIESLKPSPVDGMFAGRFYCHKGVPIDMTKGPGNFLFPEKPLTVDGEPLLNPQTGERVMIPDQTKMRTCSGFLRMFWARLAKAD
jgi:hypothetical protein